MNYDLRVEIKVWTVYLINFLRDSGVTHIELQKLCISERSLSYWANRHKFQKSLFLENWTREEWGKFFRAHNIKEEDIHIPKKQNFVILATLCLALEDADQDVGIYKKSIRSIDGFLFENELINQSYLKIMNDLLSQKDLDKIQCSNTINTFRSISINATWDYILEIVKTTVARLSDDNVMTDYLDV